MSADVKVGAHGRDRQACEPPDDLVLARVTAVLIDPTRPNVAGCAIAAQRLMRPPSDEPMIPVAFALRAA